jgi:hypothetical protein
MVSELINQTEVAWTYDMLEEFFTPLDAMTIVTYLSVQEGKRTSGRGTLTNEYARCIICWSVDGNSTTQPCGILQVDRITGLIRRNGYRSGR